MKVINNPRKIRLSLDSIDGFNLTNKSHGLKRLFPMINALNTMNGQYSQMWDFLFEHFAGLNFIEFLSLILFDDLVDFLYTGVSGHYGGHYFLDQGGLFGYLGELGFYVLQDFHWVVLTVEHFCHYLPK
jgi:hypothetical protein